MRQPKQKPILGMTHLQVGILTGLGVLVFGVIGCLAILVGSNRLAETTTVATEDPLPQHTVNDYWDNGKGTNFAYFIVADKSLTKEEAMKLITHYENQSKSYKIINVWIFCDAVYANQEAIDDLTVSDEQFFRHVLYWYISGEETNVGKSLTSYPSQVYPSIGSACR
jgi:hypothetical protein